MARDSIIEVSNVWKRYGLPPFLPWKKRTVKDSEWALRDISFSVPRGGSLGILGRNGAGKSTLLKVLAGVTPPDKGSVVISGSIFSMIELAAGMSMELTGLENIQVLGAIMGLSQAELRKITPQVEKFSELGEWLAKPVWQYSSGMVGRLAFGIAVNIRADILLVDEVLSTGDIMFQKKCQLKVQEVLAGGTTLLFVSHSPYQVEKLCEDGMLLEKGACVFKGGSTEAMREYLRRTVSAKVTLGKTDLEKQMDMRPGTGDVRVTRCYFTDEDGREISSLTTGQPVTVNIDYVAKEDVFPVNVSLTLFDTSNVPIAILSPAREKGYTEKMRKGNGTIRCHIPRFPALGMGLYFNIRINSTYPLDMVENALIFDAVPTPEIAQQTASRGIIFCESQWTQM
ncbi:MAG: ABC transporter ATP-binding protein [Deltaproteobacteria bacterium]|jgi:ABC-type polysaccharide/polyol phosphate transport system ATPase subunit|nr:ABC transporter ATP-binding protein [Deltaproteobacteria bacterium]